jgi:hypothetical protein
MKFVAVPAFIGALLLSANAAAEPTPAHLEAVKEAEQRGAEIYAYDQAAWHSTDAFQRDLKKRKWTIERAQQEGLSGFIVEPAEDGLLLATYYIYKDARFTAMARYWVRGSKVERGGFVRPGQNPNLSVQGIVLVLAREKATDAAAGQKLFTCTRGRFNTVVLPPRQDFTIPVYLMSSSVETGVFPAGGHFLFVMGADGKLVSHRAFSKGCVNVDSRRLPKKSEGFGVSHMLDPQPTEIHAFVSYNVPVKLFVIVEPGNELWEVDRGKIRYKQVIKQ